MDIINKIEPSGTQRETLQKNCKPLYDYVRYVSKIKENKKLNMPTEEAVNKAYTDAALQHQKELYRLISACQHEITRFLG